MAVKLRGFNIGKVEKLELTDDARVKVTLSILRSHMKWVKSDSKARLLKEGHPKAVELHRQIRALQDEILAKKLMRARAVFRFFPAQADGDKVRLYADASGRTELEIFDFPRQSGGEHLCLADFLAPKDSGRMDFLAMFVVTCGAGIREFAGT